MNTGQSDGQGHTTSDERLSLDKVNHDKLNHDIRASLAITNGFKQALESSFTELCQSVQHLHGVDSSSTTSDVALINRVEQLEADCRFCLSRISRSLEQLEMRIDSDTRLRSNDTTSDRSDIL